MIDEDYQAWVEYPEHRWVFNKLETAKSEIIKTKTVKKYLFTSDLSVFDFNKVTLFKYI